MKDLACEHENPPIRERAENLRRSPSQHDPFTSRRASLTAVPPSQTSKKLRTYGDEPIPARQSLQEGACDIDRGPLANIG